ARDGGGRTATAVAERSGEKTAATLAKDTVQRPGELCSDLSAKGRAHSKSLRGGTETKSSEAGPRNKSDSKVAKRTKAKINGDQCQEKIKRVKITKPGAENGTSSDKALKGNSSRNTDEASNAGALADGFIDLDTLGLDKVVPRRQGWTPTKETKTTGVISIDAQGGLDSSSAVRAAPTEAEKAQFDKVVGSFGLPTPSSMSARKTAPAVARDGSMKRRKLD
ncbi:MAG: hypothetical protein LQ340_007956, partial [Diploschistes diacapsis]